MRRTSGGFTLIELIVVLLVLGLAYGMTGPLIGETPVGLDLSTASRQLAAGMRKARDVAVTSRKEAVLTLDLHSGTFRLTDDPRIYELPKKLSYSMFTAESETMYTNTGSIRFFPDGSSSGGRITAAAGTSHQSVDVDWIAGRVKIL